MFVTTSITAIHTHQPFTNTNSENCEKNNLATETVTLIALVTTFIA